MHHQSDVNSEEFKARKYYLIEQAGIMKQELAKQQADHQKRSLNAITTTTTTIAISLVISALYMNGYCCQLLSSYI